MEPWHLARPKLVRSTSVPMQMLWRWWFLMDVHSSITSENRFPASKSGLSFFLVSLCSLKMYLFTASDKCERDLIAFSPRFWKPSMTNSLEAIWLKESPFSTAILVYTPPINTFVKKLAILLLPLNRLEEGEGVGEGWAWEEEGFWEALGVSLGLRLSNYQKTENEF